MSSDTLAQQFVITGLFLLPFVGGLILALVTWPRHPRVSLFAALGCSGVMAGSLLTLGYYFVLMQGFFGPLALTLISAVSGLLRTAGYCLILAAVFVDRPDPMKTRSDDADARLPAPRRDDPRIQTR